MKNCRRIEGIEGVSLLLILMWTLGDTANLVGGILTRQLPLQVISMSLLDWTPAVFSTLVVKT